MSVLIHSVLLAHSPDAARTQYLNHRCTIHLHSASITHLLLRHTEQVLLLVSTRMSICFNVCLIQRSLISRYFHTLPDNAICFFLLKAREGFMTSRALRVAKLLGAMAFCYNIIKKLWYSEE